MGMVTQAAIVLGATFVLDLVWAEYIRAIADEKAALGSFHAGLIIMLGAVSTILYVGDNLMVLPAAAGAAAGTYFSIWRKRRSKK